jgi:hypothetical protein
VELLHGSWVAPHGWLSHDCGQTPVLLITLPPSKHTHTGVWDGRAAAAVWSAVYTPLFSGDGGAPLCAGCSLDTSTDATAEQLVSPSRLRASLPPAGSVAVLGAGSQLGTTAPATLQLCVGALRTAGGGGGEESVAALADVALRLRSAARGKQRCAPLRRGSLYGNVSRE